MGPTHRSHRAPCIPLSPVERAIAKRSLLFWHGKKWLVQMLVVMPDHVHALVTPLERDRESWYHLGELIKSVKTYSAREINRQRGADGSLWQPEYYDRLVRNSHEFDEWSTYLIGNPVNAGLVEDPWQYDGLWCEGDGVDGSQRPARNQGPVGAGDEGEEAVLERGGRIALSRTLGVARNGSCR